MNLKSSWSSDHELFSLPSATLRVVSSQRVGESILRLSLRRPSAPVASPPPCLPPSTIVVHAGCNEGLPLRHSGFNPVGPKFDDSDLLPLVDSANMAENWQTDRYWTTGNLFWILIREVPPQMLKNQVAIDWLISRGRYSKRTFEQIRLSKKTGCQLPKLFRWINWKWTSLMRLAASRWMTRIR